MLIIMNSKSNNKIVVKEEEAMNDIIQEKKQKKEFNPKVFKLKVITVAIIIVAVGIAGAMAVSYFKSESKTTKIGFEDIGEMNTQVAYTTVVDTISDPRKLFGVTVPLTESKYIYSYDVVVKAGLDFEDIKWDENNGKIIVKLPSPKVTSCYLEEDSMEIYLEEESIFSPITLTEQNEARKKLKERGKKDAIANGLYDNAKENAEVLLTSLFKQHDKYKDYEIEFKWEK